MEEKYLNIKINLKRNNEIKLIEYKYKKRTHDERPMALDVILQAQEEQYDDHSLQQSVLNPIPREAGTIQ